MTARAESETACTRFALGPGGQAAPPWGLPAQACMRMQGCGREWLMSHKSQM